MLCGVVRGTWRECLLLACLVPLASVCVSQFQFRKRSKPSLSLLHTHSLSLALACHRQKPVHVGVISPAVSRRLMTCIHAHDHDADFPRQLHFTTAGRIRVSFFSFPFSFLLPPPQQVRRMGEVRYGVRSNRYLMIMAPAPGSSPTYLPECLPACLATCPCG